LAEPFVAVPEVFDRETALGIAKQVAANRRRAGG